MENQESVDLTGEFKPVELNDIQLSALKQAQDELDNLKKELEEKKYYSDLSDKDGKILIKFLEEDAQWKFMECLGINEVSKAINSSIDKSKKIFMGATAFEALYYYLSKVEGTGKKVNSKSIGDVDTYMRLLKAVNTVRAAASLDNEKLKELEFVVAARAEGIEPEPTTK
jgi:hypothetical protein